MAEDTTMASITNLVDTFDDSCAFSVIHLHGVPLAGRASVVSQLSHGYQSINDNILDVYAGVSELHVEEGQCSVMRSLVDNVHMIYCN